MGNDHGSKLYKPRTYPKKARKAYLAIARNKKKSAREICKAICKQ